ncbi:LysR family transcriptional regulator [Thalassotalea insulae]|uniref:LysR family transcriptional regulator n=1 Tax=Thalassotalea insulae TaxID=2056778 RepID=A0ABQ6GU94_9GAMM|nr:LysR family transcriptional regulator [Thalassotalea insulae]GLX79511.1 LysR family transcriptional regulator [Thalassotalea insulae]
MDKLKSMQSFVRLAELGSFTRVAEERNSSKSLISKEITMLENDLGVRLLHRSTRNLHLTLEGESYLARCKDILSQLESADAEVQGRHNLVKGRLKINAPMSLGLTDLSRLFADFITEYPEIELDLHLGDEKVDLVEQGFDLGFRVSSQTLDSAYVGKPLYQFNYHICVAKSYLAKHGPINHISQLSEHNCFNYSYRLGKGIWPLENGVQVSGNIRVNNTNFLMESIKRGLGIALIPEFVCREHLEQGEVVTILADVKRPKLTLYALYPSRLHVPPKLRICIEFFQRWFEQQYNNDSKL